MKNSERKQMLLEVLIMLLGLIFAHCIITRAEFAKEKTVAVVLPQNNTVDCAGVMEGIRDYAKYNDVLLDVWYEDNISVSELEELIAEEEQNHAMGMILLYPECYIEDTVSGYYDYRNVLVVTDTLKKHFSNIATFKRIDERIYSIPVPSNVIKQVMEDGDSCIYIKNTYQLGYRGMELIEKTRYSGAIGDICLEYMKVDRTAIEKGEIDFLLTE